MVDLNLIDHLATGGRGFLHRSSLLPKLFVTLVMLAAVVSSPPLEMLGLILGFQVLLMGATGLPLRQVLPLGAYPLFFAAVFALGLGGGWTPAGLVIILKAVVAGYALLLLVTTTSYAALMAFFRLFLPALLVDAMLLTYRTFFILAKQMANCLTVVRLRGGFAPRTLGTNLKSLALALGTAFIRSFDLSERLYKIMLLRGYRGKISCQHEWHRFNRWDVLPLGAGILILILVVYPK